ncbi:hypothetical protein B9Z44_14930 [Limnohabitans curvus]|jgi:hypothetical protein|uniref:Uncharacterized protein n=1 Tax=Limnohabitans curvus TaxID=323423 RepID=A0A315FT85_9BURK|nr:hypothetical protein [Limnohabitans curvus]PUE56527.1 hypothetical protein B9Z44_14930 [Limnohabitans curvus]
MKTRAVLIRLDERTHAALSQVAKQLGISRAEMLRTFLNQGLAGYDRRHEEVVDRINSLEKTVFHSNELAEVTAAMVAALDHKRSVETKVISSNLEQGISLVATGLFAQRQRINCQGVK